MGFYIQGPGRGKAEHMVAAHGARRATYDEAVGVIRTQPGKAVVCVIDNHRFDAAVFCYDLVEFNRVSDPIHDRRKKTWLVMDRARACELSGYKEPVAAPS